MERINIPAKFLLLNLSLGRSALCLNIDKHFNLRSRLSQMLASGELNFFITKFRSTRTIHFIGRLLGLWKHRSSSAVICTHVYIERCLLTVCLFMLLYEMFSTSILEKTTPRKVCLFSERPYVEPPEGFLFWWRTFRVQKGTFIWLSHKKWCHKLIFWTP